MKNKFTFLFLIMHCALFTMHHAFAQTYISGGVYTNTTWTVANSPYIVTDTIVVFPGVTLTIEPGVTVKFDDGLFLEIRNGALSAIGTLTDSIIFTSNSSSPVPGIWGGGNGGLWINGNSPSTAFNYCRIEYATMGLRCFNLIAYIKNSVISNNETGIYSINFPIDSCKFNYNTLATHSITGITINFNSFSNNTKAIEILDYCIMNNCRLDSNVIAVEEMYHSTIQSSSISYNQSGVRTHIIGGSLIKNSTINYNSIYGIIFEPGDTAFNCEIKYNSTGISLQGHVSYGGHHITECDIQYNDIGITVGSNFSIQALVTQSDISNNDVGIMITNTNVDIHCNRICNNNIYGLQMNTPWPFSATNNYWCTSDSASTAALIYDGYDNVTFGLVTFLPADTMLCYAPAGIATPSPDSWSIYPNPVLKELKIQSEVPIAIGIRIGTAIEISVYNMLGERIEIPFDAQLQTADCQLLPSGIYFIELKAPAQFFRTKFVKQ